MTKAKLFILILFASILLFVIPNISNAAVSVTRDVYSNNGSMKFTFEGLELDTGKEYEFGLTSTAVAEVENWYIIATEEYTATTATVNIMTTIRELREVINAVDTGYITIREKDSDVIALDHYAVDLKMPFLRVSNYTVIPNEKEFNSSSQAGCIQISLRNASNSVPYYQYEKITDENIINKYKEIKESNGDYLELQNMLKTTPPSSNWITWQYWNGHDTNGMNGYGRTESTISVPDEGLYYMWLYFSGTESGIKNMYGYILVDNLQPEIALESITLRDTLTIELGKTYTLSPYFNPSNATNKIVTWSSSDESVATIDNAGRITPIKVGSTIITVTSEDGNHSDTCTVTVTEAKDNNPNNNENNDNGNNGQQNNDNDNPSGGTNNNGSSGNGKDTTVSPQDLPKTGVKLGIVLGIIITFGIVLFTYRKYNKLKDIK